MSLQHELAAEVRISERGGLYPRRVPVADLQCSWELSNAGTMSAYARMDDLRLLGLGRDLKGMWVEFEHPSAGRWGGVLSGRPTSGAVVELAAEGWASLLRGRVINGSQLVSGRAAGVARVVVRGARELGATYITIGTIDESGESVSMTASGDVAVDVLGQVAEAGNVEWVIDADSVFHCGSRLGHDLSSRYRLVEDRHVVEHRTDDDLWASRQGQVYRVQSEQALALAVTTGAAVSAVGSQPQWSLSGVGDAADLAQLQFYEEAEPAEIRAFPTRTFPAPWRGVPVGIGANTPAMPTPRASPLPTTPLQMTLSNRDNCWTWCDLGNTVRVELGSIGLSGRFRIYSRGLNWAANTLTVAGEALGDE